MPRAKPIRPKDLAEKQGQIYCLFHRNVNEYGEIEKCECIVPVQDAKSWQKRLWNREVLKMIHRRFPGVG